MRGGVVFVLGLASLIFAPYRQALPAGKTLHGLMSEMGVVPREDYRRWSQDELVEVHPHIDDWIVYQRVAELPLRASEG